MSCPLATVRTLKNKGFYKSILQKYKKSTSLKLRTRGFFVSMISDSKTKAWEIAVQIVSDWAQFPTKRACDSLEQESQL
jgi:hypothetical protein